jgi:hypothetical protein
MRIPAFCMATILAPVVIGHARGSAAAGSNVPFENYAATNPQNAGNGVNRLEGMKSFQGAVTSWRLGQGRGREQTRRANTCRCT